MAKNDFVSLQKLQQIASGTALTNGLVPIPREQIARMYYLKGVNQQPIIKRCDAGTLWVDKYYVAFQIDDGDVYYTYISKHHIAEEVSAYREASEERGVKIAMPKDVLRCFKIARGDMLGTGLPYWIAAPWSEKRCAKKQK